MGLLLLVRHGQASFGAEDYDVLSETGWAQGRLLGAWLAARGVAPTVVVRGGMRRHRETLEAMVAGLDDARSSSLDRGGPTSAGAVVDPGWDEFDHVAIVAAQPDLPADLEDRRVFQGVFERATARWTAGEGAYDESFVAFESRVGTALVDAAALAGSGQTVLVVSSGGPIATVAASLTGGDWLRFNPVLVNTSVTRVVVGSTGSRLLTFNEHVHLGPDTLTYR